MVAMGKDTIPPGWYDAMIFGSLFAERNILLGFKIINGPHAGRIINRMLPVQGSDESRQSQARAELSQICATVGVMKPQNGKELHNIPMAIEIGVENGRNVILAYSRSRSTNNNSEESPSTRHIRLTRADQIEIRPPEWLLRGVLERDTFALIFGDPGSGKSFLAIDWACRVATGAPWRGQAVKAGPVVYVAGEGRQGFGRRIRAWSEHHGVMMDQVPLYVSPSVAIPDIADLAELIQAIDALNLHPTLIVLDTLARCFGGGDENATQDMGQFVKACDVLRGRYQGCAILVVHHTGHADKTRARGAIALKAALDAEYRLTHDDNLLLVATKMKDAEMPPPLAMKLTSVELPGLLDEHGNPVTSAVVEVLDAQPDAIIKQASDACRGKWQQLGLSIARRLVAASDDGHISLEAWREACRQAGMVRQNQHRVLQSLRDQSRIIVTDDTLALAS